MLYSATTANFFAVVFITSEKGGLVASAMEVFHIKGYHREKAAGQLHLNDKLTELIFSGKQGIFEVQLRKMPA